MKHSIKADELRRVPVPVKTQSYSPVAHGDIIDEVKEEIDKQP